MGEDVFGIVATILGNDKDANDKGDDTCKSPEDGASLIGSQQNVAFAFGRVTGTHIEIGEPSVPQRRDCVTQESDAEEYEEDLVILASEDANARLLLKHVNARDDEESGAEVDSQRDGDVADDIEPSADPTRHTAPSSGRKHEGLVVYT